MTFRDLPKEDNECDKSFWNNIYAQTTMFVLISFLVSIIEENIFYGIATYILIMIIYTIIEIKYILIKKK